MMPGNRRFPNRSRTVLILAEALMFLRDERGALMMDDKDTFLLWRGPFFHGAKRLLLQHELIIL